MLSAICLNLDQSKNLSSGNELISPWYLFTKKQNSGLNALEAKNIADMVICQFDRSDNITRKGEIANYQYFLLFSQCFLMPFLPGLLTLYFTDTHFDTSTTDSF